MSGSELPQPNAYVVASETTRLLLDFGASRDRTLHVPDVDAGLITHAHWDHCGGLVSLIEARVPCYATEETVRFISLVLESSVGKDRARAISDTMHAQKFHEPFQIGDLSCVFLPSGHMAGSAMIQIAGGSHEVLYTGDICTHSLLTALPIEQTRSVSVVVSEATLANYKVPEDDVLKARAQLCALSSGVIVGRALGDLQEAAAVLQANGTVFVSHHNTWRHDGLAHRPFVERVSQGDLGLVAGDLAAGSASWLAVQPMLQDPNANIVLLNGVARRAPGSVLLNTTRRSQVRIGSFSARLRAHVSWISLRMHPSRDELLNWLGVVGRDSIVVLVHGPTEGRNTIARQLRTIGIDAKVALDGDVVQLV